MNQNEKKILPHQRSALNLLEYRESNKSVYMYNNQFLHTNASIYSDKYGSGKTFTMIQLIRNDRMLWNLSMHHQMCIRNNSYANDMIVQQQVILYKRLNCSLIVVHSYIINNWIDEIMNTGLKFGVVSCDKHCNINVKEYDVIICSHTMYNTFIQKYMYGFAFKRFIMDDPISTHIYYMKRCVAGFYWFITSNPTRLYTSAFRNDILKSFFPSNMAMFLFQKLIVYNLPYQFPINVYYKNYRLDTKLPKEECSICYEEFTVYTMLKKCKHIFCNKCIEKWANIKHSCPLCRGVFSEKDLIQKHGSNKKTFYKRLFELYPNDKFIIYTNIPVFITTFNANFQLSFIKYKRDMQIIKLKKQRTINYINITPKSNTYGLYMPFVNHIIVNQIELKDSILQMIRRLDQKKNIYIHKIIS